ncbi:MAG: Na+/H+ antiporter subunit E [Burkholderiaceae bacterium]
MRLLPMPWLSLVLLIAWPLLLGDLSGLIVIGALLVAWLLPLLTARFVPEVAGAGRPGVIARLAWVVTHDIVQSNITVARLLLRDPARLRPTFVRVPVETRHPYVVDLLASIITMTPGTVSSRVIEPEEGANALPVIVVHALDCDDPQALVADIKARYEAPLLEIYGCSRSH